MTQENFKPWQKPWSTEEIIDKAQNWSLAGDAAVLKTLEAFSDNLFDKVGKTNENLNCLLDNLNKASLRLDIAKNEFLGLQNRQFVESRVYEDDETATAEEQNETVEKKGENEDELTNDIREAILSGLDVIDEYYDKVEVSVSDSEDDTETPNFVLRVKESYVDRPLPLVIGTDKWYKKWHAGLKESSSESESDKSSEKFSDTDSETDLPISNRAKLQDISDTSSESDLKVNSSNNAISSTFNDTVTSSSEEGGSVPIRAPISSSSFAEQLAAKLGSVIDSQEEVINKKPIQKTNADERKFRGSFFDEPPPLDEEDSDMFDEKPSQGIFSSDKGFFSDEEDENVPKAKIQDIARKDEEKSFSDNSSKPENEVLKKAIEDTLCKEITSSKITTGGLFEDDDEDEGLFSTNTLKTDIKKTFLPTKTASIPFYDDEPPEIDPVPEDKKKKPTGGVSIFGTSNLFGNENITDVLKKRTQDTAKVPDPQNNANENDEKIVAKQQPTIKSEKKPKTISLFDDNDDLFEDDLFSNVTPKKFTSNLFGDSPPTENIFGKDTTDFKGNRSTPINTEIVDVSPNEIKSETADILDSSSEKTSLFGKEIIKSGGLFDNFSVSSNTQNIAQEKTTNKKNDEVSKADRPRQKVASLFDDFTDDNDDEDDLFSNTKVSEKMGDKLKKTIIEEANVKAETTKSDFGGIFGNVRDEEERNLFEDQKFGANVFDSKEESKEQIDTLEKEFKSNLFDNSDVRDDEDDLFSSLRIPKKHSDSASEKKSENLTKAPIISLFDPTPPPDEDDWDTKSERDLFDEDILTNKPADDFISPKSNFLDDEPPILNMNDAGDKLFESEIKNKEKAESDKSSPIDENTASPNERRNKNDVTEDVIGKKPPIFEKIEKEIGKKEEISEENSPKKALPGKLKLNLNINVGALMPGAAPPKKELVKSQSLEATTPEKENKLGFSSSEANVNRTENNNALFGDVPTENVSTLHSVTKDRAKIPIKRRPSTRKARREQIRNSVTDFTLDSAAANLPIGVPIDAITSVETKESNAQKDETSSNVHVPNPVEAEIDSKVKSVKTDEEIQQIFTKAGGDYLENKLGDVKSDMAAKKEAKTPNKLSLFDSPDTDDDEDIFKTKESTNLAKKPVAKVVTENLFDDDDGLFGSRKPALKTDNFASPELKSDIFDDDADDIFSSKKLPPRSDMIKKSLFDDDAEDDDIFGGSSATPAFIPARPPIEGRSSKPSVVRKLNTTELSDDPLDALKK